MNDAHPGAFEDNPVGWITAVTSYAGTAGCGKLAIVR
ncbi:hypothetical protein SEEJ0720_16126 [Salmonella enterica subsp. enterica serovar Javiana str. PRS_2010_0720]|nr:hypothetical protein SEEJ0720_16126 [Salmonella enterica subsp. enterica serovar Javiana str. PRS_2010_0720]